MQTLNKLLGILVVFLCQNIMAMEETPYTPSDEFTKSTLVGAAKAIEETFDTAYDAADSLFPTIFYIIDRSEYSSWEALINHGYRNNKFKSADAMWVLQEYAKPEKLLEDGPHFVFEKFIIHPLKNSDKAQILEKLLKERSIEIKDAWYSQWAAAKFLNEKRSPLIELIELSASSPSALNAFQLIVCRLPMKVIEKDQLISRDEISTQKEGYWTWKYDERAYTVIEWINREGGNLLKQYPHYAAVAKFLLSKKLGSPGSIDDAWLDLATALNNHALISSDIFKESASRYKRTEK